MNKFYTLILLLFCKFSFSQKAESYTLVKDEKVFTDTLNKLQQNTKIINSGLKIQGSGNDICTEAITLTVGNTFTCGNTTSNTSPSSFPNTCVTTSGMGIQDFKTDWYTFNSGNNKTLAIVINTVVNTTNFTPALAVFGPYTSATSGCALSMSGPLCDNGLSFPIADSIKILENISPNSFYMITLVARENNSGGYVSYCISVQPSNLDDCEVLPSGCPVTCGNLCVFDTAAAPTASRVTNGCSPKTFSHRIQGSGLTSPSDTIEFCYDFKVDAGCSMSFGGVISASGCSGGNITSANWRIVNKSTCTVVSSGTTVPPSTTVITAGDYIYCFKYSAACDFHFSTYNYGYGTCIVQLPVELIYFKAIKDKDKVTLLWSTASEKDNIFFDIERSKDGIGFIPIGRIYSKAPNGNSDKELNYYFDDKEENEDLTYYRLKQVDKDGTIHYSKIILVTDKNQKNDFKINGVFSSGNNHEFKLFYTNYKEENLNLYIINSIGQVLLQEKISSNIGYNYYTIPTSILNNGLFNLLLENNAGQTVFMKYIK